MNLFKIILSTGIFAALVSCTYNQQDRIRELIEAPEGAFHRTRAINFVRESLNYPLSDLFSLEFQQTEQLVTGKGSFPVYLLKGDLLPLEERLVLAEVDGEIVTPLYEFEILENGDLKIFSPSGIKIQKELAFVKQADKPILYVLASFESGASAEALFTPEETGPTPILLSINKLPEQIDPEEVQNTVIGQLSL